MNHLICRSCGAPLRHVFVDLGMSPLANANLTAEALSKMEPFYPLRVFVCDKCWLVQLPEYESPEKIFGDYAYFSSYSDSWLEHAQQYVEMAVRRFGLDRGSHVIEIASNDGYLLQYFVEKEIAVLGIEPAANVADAAINKGIPTLVEFFGVNTARELAEENTLADLLVANNVFAHVPDLNDFTAGMKILLKPGGVITIEVAHLMRLVEGNQFDTIYHEHFQYYSLIAAEYVLKRHGLRVFDVDELSTHGGSLRIYACHDNNASRRVEQRVTDLKAREKAAGMTGLDYYFAFSKKVGETKGKLLEFLVSARREGKTIAGYGAPAKGNTLLNYCGIRTDFIDYTVDRSPHKQGRYLPGTHIPICHPDKIKETRPDYLLILPWNLKQEIMKQMSCIREWGGKFVAPIPEVKVE